MHEVKDVPMETFVTLRQALQMFGKWRSHAFMWDHEETSSFLPGMGSGFLEQL